MQHLAELAIRWRWLLGVGGILALLAAYPAATRLQTDESVESLFGDDDPTLQQYRQMKQWFGKDQVLVLMYRDANLASEEGMSRSRRLTERVKSLRGVNATLSPWVLNEAAEGMSASKLLPFSLGGKGDKSDLPKLMRPEDPVGSGLSEIFAGYTHSRDYSRGAVVAMVSDRAAADAVVELKEVARWWSGQPDVSEVSLVGEPVLVEQAFALVRRDGARLAIITISLLSVVVLLSLFDYRLVLMMALLIGWSVIVTKATMFALGIPLSLIASILTAIVTVVAVTAVLHLGVRYHRRRERGFTPRESTSEVLQTMAGPIFWTCATDAAGFAALWFSEILPVRQFGLMIALSALCVFLSVLMFTPMCLMLPEWRWFDGAAKVRRWLTGRLRRACLLIAMKFVRYKGITVAVSLLLAAGAVFVVSRSETETSFLKNFRKDSDIVIDYGNVEENLGGAGVWDLVLDVPATFSNSFLTDVRTLEADLIDQLGGQRGLAKAISIADATAVVGKSGPGKWMSAPIRIAAMRTRLPTFIDALISKPLPEDPEHRKLRIMLRSAEGLSADTKRNLIQGVERIAAEHVARWQNELDAVTLAPPMATGYYVLMTRLVDQLVADQWRCFAAAGILIWLLMTAATRSMRLATAALLPNLLPAFLVLAAVSLGGARINMGAAMIAAVSVGLSIDGSVHLLATYRRRRALRRGSGQAAISAAGNIGAPVMLATVALVAGFSALSTSEFIPTATFGTLVAWTLIIGTAINLSVLPALVRWIDDSTPPS
ncbi:MMPL family transporter [Roseiconus nitratireducens]|uniref:MMPL family transporter n=1 Tax=Roseiconus nitratireducens TaxID=2605748 RepID=A0A5M6D7F0_9BACT|nr:MMPL family transporter [Roseiconus nitratireducens]KAA5542202.1 MMPL family transporter [Roseiconus nitratireducens]